MVWVEVEGVIKAPELESLIESLPEMFPGAEVEAIAIEFTLPCEVDMTTDELLEALEPLSSIAVALVADDSQTSLDGFSDGSERIGRKHTRCYGHIGASNFLSDYLNTGVFMQFPPLP